MEGGLMLQARFSLLRRAKAPAKMIGKKKIDSFYRPLPKSFRKGDGSLAGKLLEMYKSEAAKKCFPLSDEEWDRLLERLRNGCTLDERNKIAEHVLLYALRTANQYVGEGVPVLDLVQEANLGIFDAADNFDLFVPNNGSNKFVAYADAWMRARVLDALMRFGPSAIVRRGSNGDLYRLRRFIRMFDQRYHRHPSADDVAVGLGVLKKYAFELMERSHFHEDRPLNPFLRGGDDKDMTLQNRLPDQTEVPPDTIVIAKDELRLSCARIARLFQSRTWEYLSPRNKVIIILRYGLDGVNRQMMLEEIGKYFSLTRERVRQIIDLRWWGRLSLPVRVEDGDKWFRSELERIYDLGDMIGQVVDVSALVPKEGLSIPSPAQLAHVLSRGRRGPQKKKVTVTLSNLHRFGSRNAVYADISVDGKVILKQVQFYDGSRFGFDSGKIADEKIRTGLERFMLSSAFRRRIERISVVDPELAGDRFRKTLRRHLSFSLVDK